jgi:hypothetical protein
MMALMVLGGEEVCDTWHEGDCKMKRFDEMMGHGLHGKHE